MVKRAMIGLALVALLAGAPSAAMAATTPTPSPTASTPAPLGPARDATWKKASAHSATLSWKAPANAAKRKVQYVVIVHIKLGSAKAITRTESAYTKTSITYSSIPAGAKLNGEVTISTRYAMDKHDAIPAYTQPQLKPSQVQDARMIATGVQLKATWKAPKNDEGTLINGYRVTLYRVPEVSSETLKMVARADLNASQREHTFKNLEGQRQYYAFIQAKNSKGLGQKTQTNLVTTGAAPMTMSPKPTEVAEPTPLPSVTPTTTSPSQSATPGVVIPPQVTPSPTAPVPSESADVQTQGVGALSQTKVKLLVVGGVVVVLTLLGLVGLRVYRRFF